MMLDNLKVYKVKSNKSFIIVYGKKIKEFERNNSEKNEFIKMLQ